MILLLFRSVLYCFKTACLCLLTDFIFRQRFAVSMRMCSTFSREVLTFVIGSFSFRNSRISNYCVLEDRSASLNFCVESFSPQNCLGKHFNVSFTYATLK